ncbi:hypothetical protein BC830DRAFT_185834 [Chytriomyces sp. MP71]|nr:hypothetical protein BC830DRAFT_185834 [Chytriomyces sp. MP71]
MTWHDRRIRDTKSTSSRSDYTGHELYAAQAELADWATTMKQQDDQLRSYAASNSGGKVVRKVDSGVSIRGHCGANAAHQDTGSLSSTCSSNNTDNEQDDHSAQISSVSRPFRSEQPRSSSTGSPPRSILKSSTSRSRTASGDEADVDAEKKLHVRFQDEVEARAKELERVRRKQEKRQKQIELHNAHPLNVKKKTASSSNGKGKSRSKSPQERQQPIGQSDLSSQLQQQSQNMAKKSGILIQEIDSSVLSLSGSTTIETESPHARIKSYDYGAWDKFNIDVELSKLDAENANPPASANATRISMLVDTESVVSQDLDVEVESDLIATRLADDEKVKGNDCFKANEYVDAVSISALLSEVLPV